MSRGRPPLYPWDAADDAELIRRRLAGETAKTIARALGAHPYAVVNRIAALRAAGLVPGRGWTAMQDRMLIAAAARGEARADIARRLGRTPAACRQRLHALRRRAADFADRDQYCFALEADRGRKAA
jgi:hypothetical protein